ncbi:hypothetical protein SUNI508_10964 [Seiridium unicorne]|uniref:Uncharacterized protein n=1 Tax=Seiridium unicorne TaxID=138068 RepID=A0ABR2UJP1_9PEZI
MQSRSSPCDPGETLCDTRYPGISNDGANQRARRVLTPPMQGTWICRIDAGLADTLAHQRRERMFPLLLLRVFVDSRSRKASRVFSHEYIVGAHGFMGSWEKWCDSPHLSHASVAILKPLKSVQLQSHLIETKSFRDLGGRLVHAQRLLCCWRNQSAHSAVLTGPQSCQPRRPSTCSRSMTLASSLSLSQGTSAADVRAAQASPYPVAAACHRYVQDRPGL